MSVGDIIFQLLSDICLKLSIPDGKIIILKVELMKVFPQIMCESRDVFTSDQLFGIIEKLFYNIFDVNHNNPIYNNNDANYSSGILAQQLNLIKFGEKLLCNLISSDLFEYDKSYRNKFIPLVFRQLEVFQQTSGLIIHHFNPMVYMVRYLENETFFGGSSHYMMKVLLLKNIYVYLNSDQLYDDAKNKITLFSFVISFFKLIKNEEFIEYHKNMQNEERLKCVLTLINFSLYVLRENIIPKNHYIIAIITCFTIMRIFIFSCQLLFHDNSFLFNKKCSIKILKLCLRFLKYPALQIESFLGNRREKLLNTFGDIRINVIQHICFFWDKLGIKKYLFIDEFFKKFIQITMINNDIVRSNSLKLVISTLQSSCNNIKTIENAIIDAFDTYLDNCPLLSEYIKLFSNDSLIVGQNIVDQNQKDIYFETINTIIDTLKQLSNFQINSNGKDSSMILKGICLYMNAQFFKSITRFDLYTRNIYQLSDLQTIQHNYLEAGCCILLHADLLEWSIKNLPQTDRYLSQLEHERKNEIMRNAIDLFIKAKEFNKCIEISKCLLKIYDTHFYDYKYTSSLLIEMSNYYKSVVNEIRCDPEYFLVGFYGINFHTSIQNQEFIFRGKNFYKLGELIKTLKTNFPLSEVTGVITNIDDKLKNAEKQSIILYI